MAKTLNVLNGFSAEELFKITELSVPMIGYLAREGYLEPAYKWGRVRGRVRYYSYRDLVVARVVQRLRESGIELKRLKRAIRSLSKNPDWVDSNGRPLDFLISDGKRIYIRTREGYLDEVKDGPRQQAFSFIINLSETSAEVEQKVPAEKRKFYTLKEEPLLFKDSGLQARAARSPGDKLTRPRRRKAAA